VDIAIGSITITVERSSVVDFSVPYYETADGFMANVPRELSKWAALSRPYQYNVWLFLIVTLILSGAVAWWISLKNARWNGKALSLRKSYETTFKIFVLQGSTISHFFKILFEFK